MTNTLNAITKEQLATLFQKDFLGHEAKLGRAVALCILATHCIMPCAQGARVTWDSRTQTKAVSQYEA
ncbi:hypothetical protein ASG63_20430 [Methylobacterium sp. Leaf94]|uniref:hypothetical protein n=1 Tax=Methylobacterium sp. Leaf94 TaxID=1736250 RepID=UPI0006F5960B|nr:hypothetical protein [Methylobacterium sp. Leaf94]KQU25480.1 hypothetical protein ASG63_20430 [Methylobacterium sp. Leaf94]